MRRSQSSAMLGTAIILGLSNKRPLGVCPSPHGSGLGSWERITGLGCVSCGGGEDIGELACGPRKGV